MSGYARGKVKTLTIRSPDTINNVNLLAEREKIPDEKDPNPHRVARKLLRESANAWLHYKELYEQLMSNITQIEKASKKKIA